MAGLKAQVLRRIEKLVKRKREREGLLAALVSEMEARANDNGALRAVMDD